MAHDGRQSAEYSFWDNLKTDLLRCLFFVPAALLIAAVLCRRWIFAIAAAVAGLLVRLLLRGDRCPHCGKRITGKKGDRCPMCDGELTGIKSGARAKYKQVLYLA